MPAPLCTDGEVLSLRVPRELADEIKRIAADEFEKQSTIARRLLRRGLTAEQDEIRAGAR